MPEYGGAQATRFNRRVFASISEEAFKDMQLVKRKTDLRKMPDVVRHILYKGLNVVLQEIEEEKNDG